WLVALMVGLGLLQLFAMGRSIHHVRDRLVRRTPHGRFTGRSPADAIAALRQAVEADPENAELHYLLADMLSSQDRHAEALEEYQEAARLAPDNDGYLVDTGVCQYRLGDIEGSVESYQKALEVNPANWVAHDNLGFDYYDLGDTDKAVEHWEKAAELAPDQADIWAGLAIGRLAQGDESGAIKAYQRAVDLNPHYLEPEWMKVEALWSDKALAAAEPLMEKARAPASRPPAPPTEPTIDI
ncbi:MAG: tetratricopeptide repeat protein, partial [Armatimonadota bacterium]